MGTDVERIVQALKFIHEVWASIPEIAVAVWLLARQMSFAAFMPLVVALGQSEELHIALLLHVTRSLTPSHPSPEGRVSWLVIHQPVLANLGQPC
jgi:hypothetical protein